MSKVIFFIATSIAVAFTATAGASEVSKRVCSERKENKPRWQKEHYAFAITADGEHCGWSYDMEAANYAAHAAVRNCKRHSNREQKKTCKLDYSK